ncbi:hypothetical protein pb186bvf_011377 [Paramecium bursaria]
MQEQLIEKWKTELFQDQALNKLFDQDLSQQEFVALILKNYNMIQLGEIFTKLTSINQSISTQLDFYIKNNYEVLLNDLSDKSDVQDSQLLQQAMDKILLLKQKLQEMFLDKYHRINNLIPIQKNGQQALLLCKQLQKYQQQVKILKQMVQQNQGQISIIDPLRVSHILFEISKSSQLIKQMQIYQNNVKFIQQVEDQVSVKALRKLQDAFTNKSFPELSQCLAIYYGLNKLEQILEIKMNSILKSITEQYKMFLGKEQTSFQSDLKALIKDDFNMVLQVWLIWQAIQQRDSYQLISYEEHLKDSFPNIFQMFWDKYTDIIIQSIQIIINSQPKFESTYKWLISSYPYILESYKEYMQLFHDQILVFPSAVLLNVNIQDYWGQLSQSIQILESLWRQQFKIKISDQIFIINSELKQQTPSQYLEKVISSFSIIYDSLVREIQQIKYDVNLYKFISSTIIAQLQLILDECLQSSQGNGINSELAVIINSFLPKLILLLMDNQLNHHIDIRQLEELIIQNNKFQKALKVDCTQVTTLIDTFLLQEKSRIQIL